MIKKHSIQKQSPDVSVKEEFFTEAVAGCAL